MVGGGGWYKLIIESALLSIRVKSKSKDFRDGQRWTKSLTIIGNITRHLIECLRPLVAKLIYNKIRIHSSYFGFCILYKLFHITIT